MSFKHAMDILDSRRRNTRPDKAWRSSSEISAGELAASWARPCLYGKPGVHGMREWLICLGHDVSALNDLNVVHVAGTKGKGSTCAFVDAFMSAHGEAFGFPRKTGRYTSPHLVSICERISINGQPISETAFQKYFFEVWNTLNAQYAEDEQPRYLQLLTLLAVHTFIRERVDVAIFETHHGGEFDATNVFEHPIVTGVTTIGEDHIEQLGPTMQNIAWHKSGIFKTGAPAFASEQDTAITSQLMERAQEKHVELRTIDTSQFMLPDHPNLKPHVQKVNCTLALALTDAFLQKKAPGYTQALGIDVVQQGLDRFQWRGRFQLLHCGNVTWFLDGAHNEISVKEAARWFSDSTHISETHADEYRILLFGQNSKARDPTVVLNCLTHALLDEKIMPHEVIFCCNVNRANVETTLLSALCQTWRSCETETVIHCEETMSDAIARVHQIGLISKCSVLATGSLALVGRIFEHFKL